MSRLSLPTGVTLPLELRKELSQLDMRLRWVSFVKGFGGLVFVTLLLAAVFLGADFFLPLPGLIRFACLSVLCVTLLWLAYHWLLVPLTRQRRWPELAFLIDRSFPDLQERVSSTVELSLIPEQDRGIASEFMWQRLQQETDKRLSRLDLWECLSLSSMAVALFAGVLTFLLAASPLLVNSGGYTLLWQRLLTPWQNLESASNLTFIVDDGDRTVPRGDDLLIHARPHWRYSEGELPREIRLTWNAERGDSMSREMSFDPRLGVFVGKIPQVAEPLTYQLSTRTARSRQYYVTVADRPRITDVSLTIEPPAYTHREPTVHEGAIGTIRAIAGSQLIATLKFEHPVETVRWNWSTLRPTSTGSPQTADGFESAPQIPDPAAQTSAVAGIVSADGYSARIELVADQTDTFQLEAVSAAGLVNRDEPQRLIQVLPDRAPRIEISGTNEPLKVRPDEILPIDLFADDDFGVVEMEVVVEQLNTGPVAPILLQWSSDQTGPAVRLVDDRFDLDLSRLTVKPGDILGYRAVARDARPVPRPNEVWTSRRVLIIDGEVKTLAGQDVEDFYESIRRQAERVRNDVATHRKQIERNRSDLDPKPRDEAQAALLENKTEWLQNKLALSLQIDDLSQKLETRPITEALSRMNAQPAQQKIDQTAAALDQFDAKSQADPLELIRADEQQLREAENLLNRLLNQLRDAERIEQELTKLQQLARRAGNLAEQAEQLNTQQSEPTENENANSDQAENNAQANSADTPDQPQATELEQLESEYSALNHDLEKLLKDRPELKQAAKNALLSNLNDASQAAAQLAAEQAELTTALDAEKQEALANNAEVLSALEQTAQLARELATASEQESSRSAQSVFNAAPTGQAVAQQQQSNLGQAQQSLENAQAALERFEQSRAQAKPLPADPQAAARQLAEKSRQLAQQAKQLQEQQKQSAAQAKKIQDQARRERRDLSPNERAQLEKADAEHSSQRQQLTEQLAGLTQATTGLQTPPQRRSARDDVIDRFDEAADELASMSDRADDRLEDAARRLDDLARDVKSPAERARTAQQPLASLKQRAEQLTEQLQNAQKKAAAGESVPENELKNIVNQQQDVTRQLLQQDVAGAERELAQAVQKQLAATQQTTDAQSADAENKSQPNDKQLAEAAKTQAQAAEKLKQLAETLEQLAAGKQSDATQATTQQQAWQDVPLTDEMKQQRFPERKEHQPDELLRRLDEIAEKQAQLQQKTAAAAVENAELDQKPELENRIKQLAGEQNQIAEQLKQSRSPDAQLPRQQALDAMKRAFEAMRNGDAQTSKQLAQQATRALDQARSQMTQAEQPEHEQNAQAQDSNPPDRASDGDDQQQAPAATAQPPAAAQTEQLAAELKQQLAQMQQKLAAAQGQQPADASTAQTEPGQTGEPNQSMDDAPTQAAQDQPQSDATSQAQSTADRLRALQDSQQKIAQQAQQLARQAEIDSPDQTELQQSLKQAAQQTATASEQMKTGQFALAAQQAQNAQQQLTEASTQPARDQAAQAATQQLADQQAQLAKQIEQLAENSQARSLARQQAQSQLNEQAEALSAALEQIASNSTAKPINDGHNGKQVGQLSEQSARTNQLMQQALQQNRSSDLSQSAQSSQTASEQLQNLAEQSAQLADKKRDTLVPEPVGAEAAAASRLLQQAQAALDQARQQAQQQAMQQAQQAASGTPQPPNPDQQPGDSAPQSNANPGDDAGRDGNNEKSAGDPQPGDSSGQPSPASDSPLQQLAAQLAQTAQALNQAHQNLQPKQGDSAQPQSTQMAQPGQSGKPGQSSDSSQGSQTAPEDGPMSGEILRSAIMREWGKRQGALEADLSDARRRVIDAEYAPLIQRYFESLADPEQR